MTSPASVDSPVRPGDVLAGKYRVERELGRGGMGVVMSALHVELDERVAIKFLLHQDPGSIDRFMREARAASKIKCEHVARIYDVGRLDGAIPYIVMEYLTGEDLDARIARDGVFEPRQLVDILIEACEAIAEAHVAGIVHRDLKPSNIFLARRTDGSDCVKLLDFGVAKLADATGTMTQTSTVMGTPFFMSPEQLISAKDADPRTDIWSLGVILYVLLTGAYPFFAESIVALAIMVREQPVPPPTEKRHDLPPALEKVILRCLEKDRQKRYPDVAALAEDLAPFASEDLRSTIARIRRIVSTGARASSSRLDTVPGVGAVDVLGATVARPSDPEMPVASPKSSTPALANSHVAVVSGGIRGQEAVSETTLHTSRRGKSGLTWAIGLAIVGILGVVAFKARPITKDTPPAAAASLATAAPSIDPTPSSVPLTTSLPGESASAVASAPSASARAIPSAAAAPHASLRVIPTGAKPSAAPSAVVPAVPSAVTSTAATTPPVTPPAASASGRTLDRTLPW